MRRRVMFLAAIALLAASCGGPEQAGPDDAETPNPDAAVERTSDDRPQTIAADDRDAPPAPTTATPLPSAPEDVIDALGEVEQAFAELDAELAGLAETLDDIDALAVFGASE